MAPSIRIQLFSGPPAQTVAGPRRGGSLRVLVRGGTQGNTLQYRLPIYGVRPYDRYLSTHVSRVPLVRTSVSEDTNSTDRHWLDRDAICRDVLEFVVLDLGRAVRRDQVIVIEREKFTTPIRTWPADRISLLRDGGFYAGPAVLNCCLSTVQQLAGPVAQVRTAPPNFVWGCRCLTPEPTLWTRITIAPDARPARRRFPGGGHPQQLLADL